MSGGPAKPATVRFYFDADVLGLAKTVAQLRSDVMYPGDPGRHRAQRRTPTCPTVSPLSRSLRKPHASFPGP